MKKQNVHTTISLKHMEILKRHTKEHGTQQKVIELALECLEENPNPGAPLSREEQLWVRLARDKSMVITQKDIFKLLLENIDLDLFREHVKHNRPIEYSVELYHRKPLKDCSLKEVVEGLVVVLGISHMFNNIEYSDDGDYYMLKSYHSLGLNSSNIFKILDESLFNSYGAKIESSTSEKTFFMKIFKNIEGQ